MQKDDRYVVVLTRSGFTLIELLVVVSIIGLLMAILVPSLNEARREARATVCATNQHHVGQSVALYQTRYRTFPVSYAYLSSQGKLDMSAEGQDRALQSGVQHYVHWSYFLYGDGKVNEKAFQCPEYDNGGAPRTNPGMKPEDWEGGQADDIGSTTPSSLEDLQAPRMSLTANAAIIPRNKFSRSLSGGKRINKLVSDSEIRFAGKTILATEFNNNWKAIAVRKHSTGLTSKSHRPVNPFYNYSTGWDEYSATESKGGRAMFTLGDPSAENFGLMPWSALQGGEGLIDSSEVNSIGRHHPGGDKDMGGTTNFLYVDGHVERKTVLDTFNKREWGDRYYSLSGSNQVDYNKPK